MPAFPGLEWVRNLSIPHKLRLATVGVSTLAIVLAAVAILFLQWKSTSDMIEQDLRTLSAVLAENTVAAISFDDRKAAAATLSALEARVDVVLACLFSDNAGDGEAFAIFRAQRAGQEYVCGPEMRSSAFTMPGFFVAQAPVSLAGERIGELILLESDQGLWESVQNKVLSILAIFVACLLLSYLFSSWMQELISAPIVALAQTTKRISSSRDFSIRASEAGRDEVGVLVDSFNTMVGEIEHAEARMLELNQSLEAQVEERNRTNQTLSLTLEQLRTTQQQLVQVEKMASLGGLVAGVAHEINTPVGIGVTAASTLASHTQEIKRQFEQEALTASGLNAYLDMASQSTEILLSNLQRAASLIQSFKQVAVDQSNLDHRRFNVADYTQEILLSLRPKLKQRDISVDLTCPESFVIDTYPGVFSQILTNLVMNSLIHAFGPEESGRIEIEVTPTDDGMALRYADDGCGIAEENLKRIFDPFFTTRRGAGGSGLGMHIVFNLITQQLGGQIKVQSAPGEGTCFDIHIKSTEHAKREAIADASRAG